MWDIRSVAVDKLVFPQGGHRYNVLKGPVITINPAPASSTLR